MSHVFVSYARTTAGQAQLDDAIPAHRAYADVIEERLREAGAVVVIWSAEAAKSEWVRSEADRARSRAIRPQPASTTRLKGRSAGESL